MTGLRDSDGGGSTSERERRGSWKACLKVIDRKLWSDRSSEQVFGPCGDTHGPAGDTVVSDERLFSRMENVKNGILFCLFFYCLQWPRPQSLLLILMDENSSCGVYLYRLCFIMLY